MTDRSIFLAFLGAGGIALLIAVLGVLNGDATCGAVVRCSSKVPITWALTGVGCMLGAIAMAIYAYRKKD